MCAILRSLAFKEDVWHQTTNTILAGSWQQDILSVNGNPQLFKKKTNAQRYVEIVASFSLTKTK